MRFLREVVMILGFVQRIKSWTQWARVPVEYMTEVNYAVTASQPELALSTTLSKMKGLRI
jgi:hypothetical protein